MTTEQPTFTWVKKISPQHFFLLPLTRQNIIPDCWDLNSYRFKDLHTLLSCVSQASFHTVGFLELSLRFQRITSQSQVSENLCPSRSCPLMGKHVHSCMCMAHPTCYDGLPIYNVFQMFTLHWRLFCKRICPYVTPQPSEGGWGCLSADKLDLCLLAGSQRLLVPFPLLTSNPIKHTHHSFRGRELVS